jgi:hypothetical protein
VGGDQISKAKFTIGDRSLGLTIYLRDTLLRISAGIPGFRIGFRGSVASSDSHCGVGMSVRGEGQPSLLLRVNFSYCRVIRKTSRRWLSPRMIYLRHLAARSEPLGPSVMA